jgi:phosphoribosyl-ATP pyrophosphohydrolase/phosphoribosyl-AMP cyclohydrolase
MKTTIDEVKFDERGLVPAVVQDARTRGVLMLAYMNAESLKRTMETGETWFWSRSRAELWHKGATSGNTQRVIDMVLDCDGDTLVVTVEPSGPACHTGRHRVSTMLFKLQTSLSKTPETWARCYELYALIETRKSERPQGFVYELSLR